MHRTDIILCGFLLNLIDSGIVETGLFVDMAVRAYFGSPDGSVKIVDKSQS